MTASKRIFTNTYLLIFCVGIVLFSSCSNGKYSILTTKDSLSVYGQTAKEIMQIAEDENIAERLKLKYQEEQSAYDNYKDLVNGRVDFVITQNDISISTNGLNREQGEGKIRVAAPLYPELLFIIYPDSLNPQSFNDLMENHTVNWGSGERSAKKIMIELSHHLGTDFKSIQVTNSNFNESDPKKRPDVMCLFTNYHDEYIDSLIATHENLTFFSFDSTSTEITGSVAQGFNLKYPTAYPFLIPSKTYNNIPAEPVLTLAVDAVLLTHADVSQYVVFDLMRAIYNDKGKSQLLNTIHGNPLEHGDLYYPLHKGALNYLNQNNPTLIERYARPLASIASVLIAGLAALFRWRNNRRYRRIRKYYDLAIEVEKKLSDHWNDFDYLEEALDEMIKIKEEVYDRLIAGKIQPNDSFRSFQSMVDSLILQITLNRNALRSKTDL